MCKFTFWCTLLCRLYFCWPWSLFFSSHNSLCVCCLTWRFATVRQCSDRAFPSKVRPFYRMHHIWQMTYRGSRFWNVPFLKGAIHKYCFEKRHFTPSNITNRDRILKPECVSGSNSPNLASLPRCWVIILVLFSSHGPMRISPLAYVIGPAPLRL